MKSKRKCFDCLVVVLLLIIQVSTVVRCDPEPKNGKKRKAFGRFAGSVAGAALGNLLTSHIKPSEKHHHHYYENPPTISLQPAVQNVPVIMQPYQPIAPSQPVFQVAAPMAPPAHPLYAQSIQAPMAPPAPPVYPQSIQAPMAPPAPPVYAQSIQAPMAPPEPPVYPQSIQAPMAPPAPPVFAQSIQPSITPPTPPGYAQSPQTPVYLPAIQHNIPVMTPQYQPTSPTQPIVSVVQQGYQSQPTVNSVVSTEPVAPVSTSPTQQHHQMTPTQPIVPVVHPGYKHRHHQMTPPQPIDQVVYPLHNVHEQQLPVNNVSLLYNQQQTVNNASSLYSQQPPVAPPTAQSQPMGFVVPHSTTKVPVTVQPQHVTVNYINPEAVKPLVPLKTMVPMATHPQTIATSPVNIFTQQQASFGPQPSAGRSQVYILSKKSGVYEKLKNGVNGFIRPGYIVVIFTVILLVFI